uniref:C-myc-binding protein n=1 Tax=Lutzomyia longipalpis TaxID=7200 RepID=A0A1B0ESF4_LUTLO
MASLREKRDEFRTYLEESGIIGFLTRVLTRLYEMRDRPSDGIEYLQNMLEEQKKAQEEAAKKASAEKPAAVQEAQIDPKTTAAAAGAVSAVSIASSSAAPPVDANSKTPSNDANIVPTTFSIHEDETKSHVSQEEKNATFSSAASYTSSHATGHREWGYKSYEERHGSNSPSLKASEIVQQSTPSPPS